MSCVVPPASPLHERSVHWLVVRANELQLPELSTVGIAAGVAVFFLFLAMWIFVLFARFRRRA